MNFPFFLLLLFFIIALIYSSVGFGGGSSYLAVMAIFLVLTILLQGQGFIYTLALIAQLIFYAVAIFGWFSETLRENTLVKIIFFFVQTNIALAQASFLFLLGKRMTVWTPSKR